MKLGPHGYTPTCGCGLLVSVACASVLDIVRSRVIVYRSSPINLVGKEIGRWTLVSEKLMACFLILFHFAFCGSPGRQVVLSASELRLLFL